MSRLDELPPDQRAALSLLLSQRKSYAAVAAMLDIPQRAVHDRAHAALAVLAPGQARAVPAERRMEIGDYMLGQQPGVAERLSTRAFLGDSEAGRAWARGLAAELAPLAGAALPDIPSSQPGNQPAAPASAGKTAGANGAAQEPSPEAGHDTASARMAASLPSSRLGGAVLLGAILAGVIVAVVLLAGGGGGSHPKRTVASSTATSGNSKASTGASGPKIDNRLTLKSPSSSSPAIGAVEILSEGGKRAFYMAAEHLAPSKGFSYVIWLYNSPTSFEGLSKAPAVSSNGRLVGGALLPSNAGSYHEILITRETTSRPAKPGTIVLRGPFSLGG